MNYSFTVNKKDPKDYQDYNIIWKYFEDKDIEVVYKVIHTADKEIPHIHYHGVIYTKYIDIKEISKSHKDFRFQITSNFNYMRWFNYCLHESKTQLHNVTEQLEELKVLNKFEQYQRIHNPKPQKVLPLLKLTIIGGI